MFSPTLNGDGRVLVNGKDRRCIGRQAGMKRRSGTEETRNNVIVIALISGSRSDVRALTA